MRTSRSLTLGVALILALCLTIHGQRAAAAPLPGWGSDLQRCVQRARDAGRMTLIFFSSKDIPPARAMRDQVLSNPRVDSALLDFELVDVDVDEQPVIAGQFKISQLPVFAVLDARGREIDRFGGFMPPRVFMETLRAAADPRQSIPVLREKIKEDNRDVKSRYLLAKKYARDKNRDGLDQMIDQVTQIDPDNREGYLDNVVFLKLMTSLNPKQPKEGLRKCEFFLRDFPDSDCSDQVDLARSQMAYQAGDTRTCLNILEDFPRNYPDSPLADQVSRDLATIRASLARR